MFYYALIILGDLWLEADPIHHGSLNSCGFPLVRGFLCRREKRTEQENVFYNWERDEDPLQEEKMILECGGCIAFQYIPRKWPGPESEGGQMQEIVSLR